MAISAKKSWEFEVSCPMSTTTRLSMPTLLRPKLMRVKEIEFAIKVPRGRVKRYWAEFALLALCRLKGQDFEPLLRLRSDEMDNRVTHFASSLVVINETIVYKDEADGLAKLRVVLGA